MKELSVGIVITSFTRGKASPQNTAFLIGQGWRILIKYSKVDILVTLIGGNLECGDRFEVCQFDEVCIGVMIGYDREYPESARADAARRRAHPGAKRLRHHAPQIAGAFGPRD